MNKRSILAGFLVCIVALSAVAAGQQVAISNPYSVKVPDRSLGDLIKDGKYDYLDPAMPAQLPALDNPSKGKTVEVVLVSGVWGALNVLLNHHENSKLQPLTPYELLALGAQYPDLQKEGPIVSLNRSWVAPDNYHQVFVLGKKKEGTRALFFATLEKIWNSSYRFAAVRKK